MQTLRFPFYVSCSYSEHLRRKDSHAICIRLSRPDSTTRVNKSVRIVEGAVIGIQAYICG